MLKPYICTSRKLDSIVYGLEDLVIEATTLWPLYYEAYGRRRSG